MNATKSTLHCVSADFPVRRTRYLRFIELWEPRNWVLKVYLHSAHRVLASVRSALEKGDQDRTRQAERSSIQSKIAALSNRERDVLEGLVAGRANKQIAYDLGISARTIENYRANLMIKMQAASLSDLVRMALIAGMLDAGAKDAGGAA
jgi:DNA-binding NarL/FixJ family response regulator